MSEPNERDWQIAAEQIAAEIRSTGQRYERREVWLARLGIYVLTPGDAGVLIAAYREECEAPLRQRIADLEQKATRVRCCYSGSVEACPIHEKKVRHGTD